MSNDKTQTENPTPKSETIVITIDKKKLKKYALIGGSILTGAIAVTALLNLNEKMADENLPHLEADLDFVNPADENSND